MPLLAAAVIAVLCLLAAPPPALAQQPRAEGGSGSGMTIMTSPPGARVVLSGSGEVGGMAPLDLGTLWMGRYSVLVEAPGHATALGSLDFPPPGMRPVALSPPPGISGGLILRSLNFPGVPDLLSHHTERGIAFAVVGVGGVGAVFRNHIQYRNKLEDLDVDSQDRAMDFRYARSRWTMFTGAVWGMSALDYVLHPRMDLIESTPTRVTIGTPRLTRGSVLWRSALVPGAGQDYANRKYRGLIWLGAILTTGAAYVIADESHHRIVSKLSRAENLLAVAPPAEVPDRQADVDHFASREETSRQLVDGLALGTFGLYILNVIDAGIIPLGGDGVSTTRKFSISPSMNPHQAGVAIKHRF